MEIHCIIHYKAIRFFVFFFESKVEKGIVSPEPVDGFQKFERPLEAEKILDNLYRTDF